MSSRKSKSKDGSSLPLYMSGASLLVAVAGTGYLNSVVDGISKSLNDNSERLSRVIQKLSDHNIHGTHIKQLSVIAKTNKANSRAVAEHINRHRMMMEHMLTVQEQTQDQIKELQALLSTDDKVVKQTNFTPVRDMRMVRQQPSPRQEMYSPSPRRDAYASQELDWGSPRGEGYDAYSPSPRSPVSRGKPAPTSDDDFLNSF